MRSYSGGPVSEINLPVEEVIKDAFVGHFSNDTLNRAEKVIFHTIFRGRITFLIHTRQDFFF